MLSLDCTFKDLESSDYVALQAWGRVGANHYLVRRLKERLSFTATCDALRTWSALFPDAVAVLVEDKANGSAVINSLQSAIGGLVPVEPAGGKVARAYAMQAEHEAGNFWLPDPSIDPAIEVYLAEASAFPGAPNDDEVDATTQYANWVRPRVRQMGIHDWMRQQAQAAQEARAKS